MFVFASQTSNIADAKTKTTNDNTKYIYRAITKAGEFKDGEDKRDPIQIVV